MDKKETFHVVSTYRETPTDHRHMKEETRETSYMRLIHYLLKSRENRRKNTGHREVKKKSLI